MTVQELINFLKKYKNKNHEIYLYNEEYNKSLKLQTYMIEDEMDNKLEIDFDFSDD